MVVKFIEFRLVTGQTGIQPVERQLPWGTVAYRYMKQTVSNSRWEHFIGTPKALSGWVYFGEEYTLQEFVKEFESEDEIHLHWLAEGWQRAVRVTAYGQNQWYELKEGDIVQTAPEVGKPAINEAFLKPSKDVLERGDAMQNAPEEEKPADGTKSPVQEQK